MPDDPQQNPGGISGLGPRPGVPYGNSTTARSTPASAPIYGAQRFDPATQSVVRSIQVESLDALARRAGRK
jgi:hypothetical protein